MEENQVFRHKLLQALSLPERSQEVRAEMHPNEIKCDENMVWLSSKISPVRVLASPA